MRVHRYLIACVQIQKPLHTWKCTINVLRLCTFLSVSIYTWRGTSLADVMHPNFKMHISNIAGYL